MKLVFVLALISIGSIQAYKTYSGYQVLRTAALDESTVHKITPLYNRHEFEFLSEPRVGEPVSILVSPENAALLRSTLDVLGLQPDVHLSDVGVHVEKERTEIEHLRRTENRTIADRPNLDRFLTLDEINAYLDSVVAAHPTIASFVNIGLSQEGRMMRVLKLSNGPGKPGVWIESGIHACEWAGPPVALNAIAELTENLAVNQAMLDKNDFYFIVVANPDGYVFAWEHMRFWRKNRRPNVGTKCIGTDLNRNWDWNWKNTGEPCAVMYGGSSPMSAVEVKNMGMFLMLNPTITQYVSLHSYGKFMLYPWGDTPEPIPNVAEVDRIGKEAAAAIQAVRGTKYTVGSVYSLMYTANGGSLGFVYGGLNIMAPFTLEMPGGGTVGFDLPVSEVRPVATETWEALKVIASYTPARRGM